MQYWLYIPPIIHAPQLASCRGVRRGREDLSAVRAELHVHPRPHEVGAGYGQHVRQAEGGKSRQPAP